jgi:hypothetical protein
MKSVRKERDATTVLLESQDVQCRRHAERHARLAGGGAKARGGLRRQARDAADAEQASEGAGRGVDLGHVAAHRAGRVEGEGARGGDAVQVVVLGRVVGTLEHVEHLVRHDEAACGRGEGRTNETDEGLC